MSEHYTCGPVHYIPEFIGPPKKLSLSTMLLLLVNLLAMTSVLPPPPFTTLPSQPLFPCCATYAAYLLPSLAYIVSGAPASGGDCVN